ncbi:MAG: hypothetical protein J0L63_17920 [Anaerolineae bacterium]|nr:hypothetical protein [Anaerolineae bacterium]MBN8620796.1 hypothetical protein [Anaerolineae bacterium]
MLHPQDPIRGRLLLGYEEALLDSRQHSRYARRHWRRFRLPRSRHYPLWAVERRCEQRR